MKDYLCYYELHVDDRTFLVHVIVPAESENEALAQLDNQEGKHYYLQAKGCLGKATPKLLREFMSAPEGV